jgi:hypothetical protein
MNALRGFATCTLLLIGLSSGACDDHSGGHDISLGGVNHREGLNNPLGAGCTACHGNDLRGSAAPSCYSCHDNADHAVIYGGIRHNAVVDCTRCHGPKNNGGIGPACAECHG